MVRKRRFSAKCEYLAKRAGLVKRAPVCCTATQDNVRFFSRFQARIVDIDGCLDYLLRRRKGAQSGLFQVSSTDKRVFFAHRSSQSKT